jgi:hypothetical protein
MICNSFSVDNALKYTKTKYPQLHFNILKHEGIQIKLSNLNGVVKGYFTPPVTFYIQKEDVKR